MQPNILCVNPYIHDFCAHDFWVRPLGLSWVAAYLAQHGYKISFIDCLDRYHPLLLKSQGLTKPKGHRNGSGPMVQTIIEKPKEYGKFKRHYRRFGMPIALFEQILDTIPPPQAILVGSMMTYWYQGVKETVALLRQKFPHVPIALGGVYATLCTEHAKKNIGADIVLPGPGEVKALRWLDGITGLSHDDSQNELLPATNLLIPYHGYLSPNSSAAIATSLGCPLACSYCASKYLQPVFRQRNVSDVVKEIFHLAFHQHVHNIAFYDDALLVNASHHIMPILQAVAEKSLSIKFHTVNGMHSRLITPELAALMRKAKVETLRFSYEQASVFSPHSQPQVEDHDLAHAVECFRRCDPPDRPAKIDVYVKSWMPGQSIEQMVAGYLYTHSLGCYVSMTEYSPVPGTPDFEKTMSLYHLDGNEPLFHNNTTLPYFLGYDYDTQVQPLKHLINVLNYATSSGLNLVKQPNLSRPFMQAMQQLTTMKS